MSIPVRETHTKREEQAMFVFAASAFIVALAVLLYVLWMIFSSVRATAFDADGVRCYAKADQTVCLKTAEPPR